MREKKLQQQIYIRPLHLFVNNIFLLASALLLSKNDLTRAEINKIMNFVIVWRYCGVQNKYKYLTSVAC